MATTGTNTITGKLINQAGLAVVSIYILTTVHHVYGGLVDGIEGRLHVPIFMALPLLITLGSLYFYRRTDSWMALTIYSMTAILIFVLLSGIIHGAYAHTYKDILFLLNESPSLYYSLNPQEHYPPDNLLFEMTGILEMVVAYFVARSTFHLIRDRQKRNMLSATPKQIPPLS
jgi:hypothetical protein